MKIVIATIKSWNITNALRFKESRTEDEVFIISRKDELNLQNIQRIQPQYIFIPHWSYIIPETIYENWNCVVFHMTDLPFGRGGSPLQNLIVRGYKETRISAIKVTGQVDAGPIYLKRDLGLEGSAQEILKRASDLIFNEMIPCFLGRELSPMAQEGEVTLFKRRRPEESVIPAGMGLQQLYDHIRMLDGEGYPRAYLELDHCVIEFFNAEYKNGRIKAVVEIKEEP